MSRAKQRSVTGARPNQKATSGRGFTLIELMITVAMIGVLSALGLVGYRKFIHSSQSAEAKAMIGGIRGGQEMYKADMLTYLNVSTSLTDWYPNTSPNDTRMNWVQPSDTRFTDPARGWALLAIAADGPVRFGYATVAGIGGTLTPPNAIIPNPTMPTLPAGVPWYVIQAENDHDNNGKFAVFASASVSGEILSQNEQE